MRDQGDVGGEDAGVWRRPADLLRPDILDPVVLRDLAQPLEHRRRRVHRDHRAAGVVERSRERQREPPGSGTDVQPGFPWPDQVEEPIEDRVVPAPRIRAKQQPDGRVEIRAVGNLANAVDLVAVRLDPRAPGSFAGTGQVGGRVDIGVRSGDRDFVHEIRMHLQQGAEAAIPIRLVSERQGRAPDQDGVSAGVVVIPRHDDRARTIDRCVEERADRLERHQRLIAEQNEHGIDVRVDGRHSHLE